MSEGTLCDKLKNQSGAIKQISYQQHAIEKLNERFEKPAQIVVYK